MSYTLKRSSEGALAELPPGYEVVENVNGQASVRRPRPRLISEEEEALVRSALNKQRPDHRVEIKGAEITFFHPQFDAVGIADQYDPFDIGLGLNEKLEAMVRKQLGDEVVDQQIRARRESIRLRAEQQMGYSAVMRFRLADRQRRVFRVDRMTYIGDGGWHFLDEMPLPAAARKYLKHLGRESFFELI